MRLRVVGDTHLLAIREHIRRLEAYAAELEKDEARKGELGAFAREGRLLGVWHTRAQAAHPLWPNVSAAQYARDKSQRQGTLAQ